MQELSTEKEEAIFEEVSPLSKLKPTPRMCSVPCSHAHLCNDGSQCYSTCFPCFDLRKGKIRQTALVNPPNDNETGFANWVLIFPHWSRELSFILTVECRSHSILIPIIYKLFISGADISQLALDCGCCPYELYCETTEEGTGILSFVWDCSECVSNHKEE